MPSRFNAEVLAGMLFLLIGGIFILGTADLSYGTWRRIGPGAFPTLVAAILMAIGVIVVVRGAMHAAPGITALFQPGRLAVVSASILAFGLTVRGAGLLPAVFLCTLIASLASRPFRPLAMGLYGLLLGAICSLVFIKGLGMQSRMLGPWFGF